MITGKMTSNIDQIQKYVKLVPKDITKATHKSINDTLFDLRRRYTHEMEKAFDKPNMKYLNRAFEITKATPDFLGGYIGIKDQSHGKGTSFLDVFGHNVKGGMREQKRFEKALVSHGHMTKDMIASPAKNTPLDQYGGISGKFASMLLSYLGLYSKAGFKANMTIKKKNKMADYGKSAGGYKKINGVTYFVVSHNRTYRGKQSYLHPGIWKRSGTHGVSIEPVILFVKQKSYKKRLDFFGIAEDEIRKKFYKHWVRAYDGEVAKRG